MRISPVITAWCMSDREIGRSWFWVRSSRFRSISIKVIDLPFCALNSNAIAERWVRTVREGCLDKLLILNEVHLRCVMNEYVAHYNQWHPHQGVLTSRHRTTSKVHSKVWQVAGVRLSGFDPCWVHSSGFVLRAPDGCSSLRKTDDRGWALMVRRKMSGRA